MDSSQATKKSSNRIAGHIAKTTQAAEIGDKKYLICVGRRDKKAFRISITDKRAFPSENKDVSTLHERCNLKSGDKVTLIWNQSTNISAGVLIVAIFFKYADSSINADKWVLNLAKKLNNFDTRSTTLSVDTKAILDICQDDEIDSSDPFENYAPTAMDEPQDDCYADFELNVAQKSMNQRKFQAQSLQAQSQKPCFDELACNAQLKSVIETFKKEIISDMCKEISVQIAPLQLQITNMKRSLDNLCQRHVTTESKIVQKVQHLSHVLDPGKVRFGEITVGKNLYDENRTDLPVWTLEEIDITPLINELYCKFGCSPNKFFKQVICHMYGDLLCNFKIIIKRIYNDDHRCTRGSLESFDPTGHALIQNIIVKYHNVHALEIIETQSPQSKRQLSRCEFVSLICKVLDIWSGKAFCKNGRSKPNVDCELLQLLEKGCRLKAEDTKENIKEFIAMYKALECRPNQKRKRPSMSISLAPQKQKSVAHLQENESDSHCSSGNQEDND